MSGAAADGIDDRDVPKFDLWNAAFNGDMEKVRVLIKDKKVPVDSADDDDVTALHIAAATGNNNLVLRLLDYDANINACNQLGMTAYHYAAREGRLNVIDTLLQRGVNHAKTTSLGVSALTLACAGGHVDVVRRLLTFQQERLSEGPKRSLAPTPLIVATCSKSPQICNYLARAGEQLDLTIDTLKGLSALSIAIICTPGVYMVRSLLDLGASPSKRGLHRLPPEELAKEMKRKDLENLFSDKRSYRSRLEAHFDPRKEIKENKIIEREGPPTQNGCSLLMYAIIARSLQSARYLLLNRDADVNQRDNLLITALQIACLLRFDEIIPVLLQRSSDITAVNKFGLTAYDLFLLSCDVIEGGSLRQHLHFCRPSEMKLNLSNSSSNLLSALQKKNIFSKVSSQILQTQTKPESILPKDWLEARIKYQPAKERNNYKFASVEDILRTTKTAKPPESNEFDMETEAMREYMEEMQNFQVTCFTDFYGEREKTPPKPSEYYDKAQLNARRSGYHRKPEDVRRLPIIRPRKDSIEREYRKPRTISMMDSSPVQMRTTPRMLKKSRDVTEQSVRVRVTQVPTVVVRPRVVNNPVVNNALPTETIWAHFVSRGQHQLMEALKREEIDHHTFFMLRQQHLVEMGIYTPENKRVIEEIQQALHTGTM